ncbi:MAG: hypothetical protein GY931_19585 [Maribacter sp.]|nr:hypothetical protein [Maribacter sp.]
MTTSEILIYGFVLVGIVGAIMAMIKAPKELWFSLPKYENKGVDYAPEYSKKERIMIMLKILAWAIPFITIFEFWFVDWFSEYSRNANCYNYGSLNGVHLVFYGIFVFVPLSFAIILLLTQGRRSFKVIRIEQNPLPNEKVFSPTKYKYGKAATIQPIVVLLLIMCLFGLSVWGGFQAHEITKDIKPCTVNKSLNQIGAINAPTG